MLVAALIVSLIVNVILLVLVIGSLQAEAVRRTILSGMAAGGGISAARLDFRLGISRIYELTKEREEKFTGRTEGSYEIWTRPDNAELGSYAAEMAKSFALNYNAQMREMHDQPELHTLDHEYRRARRFQPLGGEGLCQDERGP